MPIKDIQNKDGIFYIKHEGERVGIMLQGDWQKREGLNHYMAKKKIERMHVQALHGSGSGRENIFIVVDNPKGVIFSSSELLRADKTFLLFDGFKYNRVMFVTDFLIENPEYNSKQNIENQLHNDNPEMLSGLQVRKVSNKCINFVICQKQ